MINEPTAENLAPIETETSERTETTYDVAGRITSLRYKRLENLGNYENEDLSATIEVREGDDPDVAVAALKGWVQGQIGRMRDSRSEVRQLEKHLWSMKTDVSMARSELARLESAWQQAKVLLAAHGITPETHPQLGWNFPVWREESGAVAVEDEGDLDSDDDSDDDDEAPY